MVIFFVICLFAPTAFSHSFCFLFLSFCFCLSSKEKQTCVFFFFSYSFFSLLLILYLKIHIQVSQTINFKTEDSVISWKLWNAETLVPDVVWLRFRLFANKAVEIWKIVEKRILIFFLEFVIWHPHVLSRCISSRTYVCLHPE